VLKETEDDSRVREVDVLEGVHFTPMDVLVSIKGEERPMELSYRELGILSHRDPDDVSFQTLLQYNLTFPLANLVLLMVAVPWMLGRERGKRLEGLMVGCLMCVFYFCFEFFTRALGMDGDLSPVMASWLPILIFGSLGIVLMESIRT
jgi:lipopolysaccharide export system permease protein